MKVIVTGATSFLGTHFVEMVKNKVEDVISLSSKEIDITNSISFPSGDVLYHLAANSRIYMAREKIVEDFQINAIGTINVLEAAYKAGIKKIVYISTALVYEDLYNSNEESPVGSTKVSGPYGVSKLVGELYIKQYAFERGFEYVILRPSGLYGPGMKKNPIYDMVMGFVTGMPIKLHHDINSEFDFIHVKDVARAMVMALDWKDEILNVSHGKGVKLFEVYSILREIEGRDIPISSSGTCVKLLFDNRKILEKGWYENYSLKDGLQETINYLRRKKK